MNKVGSGMVHLYSAHSHRSSDICLNAVIFMAYWECGFQLVIFGHPSHESECHSSSSECYSSALLVGMLTVNRLAAENTFDQLCLSVYRLICIIL